MKRKKFSNRTLALICAVGIMMFGQIIPTSVATNSSGPAPAPGDADLSAENRTLEGFLTDLDKFDKRNAELSQKESLTREELNLHERTGTDLKRRVGEIQDALRDVIRKLKAAGQWDNLDQIVLAKVSDGRVQDFIRREGFKKLLEDTALGASTSSDEIVRPLEKLRNRVKAQTQKSFEPANSTTFARVVHVTFSPGPVMTNTGLRCRFALLREGLSAGFSKNGGSSKASQDAAMCHCFGLGVGCSGYAPTE
jgi:hypothetical protein